MNFLYPTFLYGLFALSIPVIIHLFNFRKTKKVYFSNTQFLKKVKEANSSKLKLKHYLILLSRLLFIFFLVMAFAQPFLPSTKKQNANSKTIIYLDNSLSMANETGEGISAFDAALGHVDQLTEIYPSGRQYHVLTNDFRPFSNFPKGKLEVKDLITEIELTGIKRSSDDIMKRIELITKGENSEVYWLSDFQRTNIEGQIGSDSVLDLNLVPLEFNSTKNIYIDSIYLDNPFFVGDKKLKLHAVVANKGGGKVSDLILKVLINNVESATASIDIDPNGRSTASFDLSFELGGFNRGQISFEEFPVTFDNDFYFIINSGQRIKIMEIYGSERSMSIPGVFGNNDLFDLTSMDINNLDYGLVPQSDLVIVNQISQVDPSFAALLNKYVAGSGQVFFIPSSNPDVNSYKTIAGLSRIQLSDTTSLSDLSPPDFDNPFFANVFEEKNLKFQMPRATNLLSWGRDRSALLKFKTRKPYLSKVAQGQGTVYLLGAPLSSSFSTFQNHAIFVPVMYKMAVAAASGESRLFYSVDEGQLSIPIDSLGKNQVVKLKRDEQEIIPAQRMTSRSVEMEIPKYTLSAGFYDVVASESTLSSVAFNYSPLESDLRQLNSDELKESFAGSVDIINATDQNDFTSSVKNKYIGQPLWKYAVMLALIFLLVEVLLIRFFP